VNVDNYITDVYFISICSHFGHRALDVPEDSLAV